MKPEGNDWSLTMASAFPTRGHDIGHSIWVHNRAVGSIVEALRPYDYDTVRTGIVKEGTMNLTLSIAIVALVAWAVLLFGLHIGSGSVNLLYAVAAIATARRIIVGAPKYLS